MKFDNKMSEDKRIKKKVWSWKKLIITYVVMLLLVGFQMGIITASFFAILPNFLQVFIVMGYWALVSIIFLLITNYQIKKTYDEPMKKLSKGAKCVAEGDFSIYLVPSHVGNEVDYLDVMFQDFNTMVAELGSIETLKNDFIANVSHEIKTPLAVICNYITMLQNPELSDGERKRYQNSLFDAASRLNTLVTNILKLNKLQNQRICYEYTNFDLCGQLSECVLNFESLWVKKNLELNVEMEDRSIINSDEETMKLVWNNLIANAIKFTSEGGSISIRQYSDSTYTTVEISDTGCGMSEETMKHIYDKFYQGDTSHSTEGNGLGLTLVSKVLDYSGGFITVVSEIGKGSTFKVVLPVTK